MSSQLGCHSRVNREIVEPENVRTLDKKSPFLKAHMLDGTVYVLSEWEVVADGRGIHGVGRHLDANRETLGMGHFTVALDSVALFETNVKTISPSIVALSILTGASVALTAACAANPKACFGSCPTFYAWDGARYALKAEGFSSSILPSLEATDLDALEGAHPTGTSLRLIMKNEALETHVVRHVDVLAVPRPKGHRVFATPDGRFRQVRTLLSPKACIASEGNCLPALLQSDGVERTSATGSDDLGSKEVIDLVFDAPTRGSLGVVITARQTLLTTFLFYQTLAYLGTHAGEALSTVERDPEAGRRTLSGLPRTSGGIEVLTQDRNGIWIQEGQFRETGPLAMEVKVIPLSQTIPNPGRIRLRLTRGLWRLDSIALAPLGREVEPVRLKPARIAEADGTMEPLGDPPPGHRWPIVTHPGDEYVLTYTLPAGSQEYELFLESRGYYLEWIRREWMAEENLHRARMMIAQPELALRVLAPEYKAWEKDMDKLFWGSRYASR